MRPIVDGVSAQIGNPDQCRAGTQGALNCHLRFYGIEFIPEVFPLLFYFQLRASARQFNDIFIQHIKTSFSFPN
jgi:hypothetical protein